MEIWTDYYVVLAALIAIIGISWTVLWFLVPFKIAAIAKDIAIIRHEAQKRRAMGAGQ